MKEDLPEGFWRTLPRNPDGYGTHVALLARRAREEQAGPVHPEGLRRFLDTAQEDKPLTIGEIWAFPAILRLEVLEELARIRPASGPRPGEPDEEAEPLAERMSSAILGLRALATADWKDFFESVSLVERELRRDPAGAYAHMDFATRDRYRQKVEALARGSGRTEAEVAREVVRRSEAAAAGRARHVGYYLIDAGCAPPSSATSATGRRRGRGPAAGCGAIPVSRIWAASG